MNTEFQNLPNPLQNRATRPSIKKVCRVLISEIC